MQFDSRPFGHTGVVRPNPKFFNMTFAEPVAAESNAPPRPGNSLELSLIARQFVFLNNNADSGSTQLKWDAYQFQEQLLARLHIGNKLTITVAPGFLSFNDASSGGSPGPHGAIVSLAAMTGQTFANDGTLNNSQPFPVTQRDLNIILAPGDITYKIFGKPLSLSGILRTTSRGTIVSTETTVHCFHATSTLRGRRRRVSVVAYSPGFRMT
jgi:hypothetical protein